MKSALTVVLFRLFTIGVFVDGKEASNVSVMEGDSVTLKTGVTGVQTVDDIEWRFKGNRIDKFVDGLQLNSQTGDLKISNIRTKDSGLYKVKISSNSTRGSSEMEFNVNVVFADEVKTVSVMEGDSVPLDTDPTYIQGSDVIRWRFEKQKSLVAEINRTAGIFNTYDAVLDGRFRDRLKLNNQTGSLIITNTRTTDSGLYEVEISSTRRRYTTHHTQSFSVTVRDVFGEVMSAMEGNPVTLNTGVTKNPGDVFLWYFEYTLIAQINGHPDTSCLYYGKDKIFKDRLDVDHKTGSLIITTSRPEHTGRYQAEFIEGKPGKTETIITSSKCERTKINPKRSNLVIHKSFILIVGGSGLSPGAVAGYALLAAAVGAAVAVLAGVVVYYRRTISDLERQMKENGVNLKKEKTDDSATELDDPLNREQQ